MRATTRYGNAFVYETYLHHLVRQDHRHNFSIYFYYFYLHESMAQPLAARLAAFFPQALLALLLGWRFYRDLPFACFLLTFTFVAYNKVCTSQVRQSDDSRLALPLCVGLVH